MVAAEPKASSVPPYIASFGRNNFWRKGILPHVSATSLVIVITMSEESNLRDKICSLALSSGVLSLLVGAPKQCELEAAHDPTLSNRSRERGALASALSSLSSFDKVQDPLPWEWSCPPLRWVFPH